MRQTFRSAVLFWKKMPIEWKKITKRGIIDKSEGTEIQNK